MTAKPSQCLYKRKTYDICGPLRRKKHVKNTQLFLRT